MRQGTPLTDQDRDSWLAALQHLIRTLLRTRQSAVIACSALKQAYRDRLKEHHQEVIFVYLKADYDLINRRLRTRTGHFMNANLLGSQFETLEEPTDAITVHAAQTPQAIVFQIQQQLQTV